MHAAFMTSLFPQQNSSTTNQQPATQEFLGVRKRMIRTNGREDSRPGQPCWVKLQRFFVPRKSIKLCDLDSKWFPIPFPSSRLKLLAECWKPEVRSIDAPTCRRMRSEFLEQMHNKLRAKFGRSCNWNDVWLYIFHYIFLTCHKSWFTDNNQNLTSYGLHGCFLQLQINLGHFG